MSAVYAGTSNPAVPRSREAIAGLFAGLDVIEPGLVPVAQWRPDEPGDTDPGKGWLLGGIGRKRA